MDKNIDDIFEREDDRREGMIELLKDYLDTIDNDELDEQYNIQKFTAAELIIFLAYYVGETHYEMIGILDECKDDLRKRLSDIRKDMIDGDDE
jgi:uncharacterized protein (DUF2164 family)